MTNGLHTVANFDLIPQQTLTPYSYAVLKTV